MMGLSNWLAGHVDGDDRLLGLQASLPVCEPLETRLLLSSTPLIDVELVAAASPTASDTAAVVPSSVSSVDVGDTFYVEVWAKNVDGSPNGITGGYLDVSFDPSVVTGGTISHGGLYTNLTDGAVDNTAGLIDDLGGNADPGVTNMGDDEWVRLGYVSFTADSAGTAPFTSGAAIDRFARAPEGAVDWNNVELNAPPVSVLIGADDVVPPGSVTVTASSQLPHTPAAALVDGSGLVAGSHSTHYGDMWLSQPGASPAVRFDLGGAYLLSGMHVWNYNQVNGTGVPLTNRGIQTVDVYVSVTGFGDPTSNPAQWTLLSDDLLLAEAAGDAGYAGQSYGLSANGDAARYVLLTNMTNWGGTHTGLSEVRFSHQGTVSLGDEIDSVSVTASSQLPHTPVERLVDGSGIVGGSHSTHYGDMWLSPGASPTLRFDLGQAYLLFDMHVWNYNQVSMTGAPLTNRGVQTANVYVSTTGIGDPTSNPSDWKLLSGDLLFAQASGDAGYTGQSYGLSAEGIAAQFVMFTDMTNWGGTHTGLSEVRFNYPGTLSLSDQVESASVTASSQLPHTPAEHMVDGSGIAGTSHSTHYGDMWLSQPGASPTLRFDLGQAYRLSGMHVWNYNQVSQTGTPLTNRGIQMADVYVSTTGLGDPTSNEDQWILISNDLPLDEATGDPGYTGTPYELPVRGLAARYVLLTNMTNWGGTHTGLSEVQFSHLGPVPLGDQIEGVSATASSQLPHTPVERLVDGSGLSDGLHSTHYGDMWLSQAGASPTVRFDLGSARTLIGMHVWNYNQVSGTGTPLTNRGVQTADVYVSTTGTGDPTSNPSQWTLLSDDLLFDEATGTAGYAGQSHQLSADGITARYVLLTNMTNWGGTNTGLSEVRFLART